MQWICELWIWTVRVTADRTVGVGTGGIGKAFHFILMASQQRTRWALQARPLSSGRRSPSICNMMSELGPQQNARITFANSSTCVFTLSMMVLLTLLCFRSSSFFAVSSFRFCSSLHEAMLVFVRARQTTVDIPLPFGKFEAQAVQHELMFIAKDFFGTHLLCGQLGEFL